MAPWFALALGLGMGIAVGAILERRRKREVTHVYNVTGFIGDEAKLARHLHEMIASDRPN